MLHKNDLKSILTLIIGVCALASDATFSALLNKQYGDHTATVVLAIIGIIGIVASQTIRVLNAPAGQADILAAMVQTLLNIQQILAQPQPAPVVNVHNVMPGPDGRTPAVPVTIPPAPGAGSLIGPGGIMPPSQYGAVQPGSCAVAAAPTASVQLTGGSVATVETPSTPSPAAPIESTSAAAAPAQPAAQPQGAP